MRRMNRRAISHSDVWAQTGNGFNEKVPEVRRLGDHSAAARLQLQGMQSHPWSLRTTWTPASLLAEMDQAGIEPGQWIITNDDVAEYVRFNPNRFVGAATVDLSDPVAAVKELDRAVKVLGLKAFRVVQWLWKLPPTDKLFYPLYVKCVELDIPFCCQMPSETGRPIPYIDEVAIAFPDLKIVCGHIGYPWTEEMCAVAWKHKNVYIDTSAYDPKYYPQELIRFMTTTGKTKVMFGTNFPMLNLKTCVDNVKKLKLSPEVLALFLYKTADRVFKLQPSPKL